MQSVSAQNRLAWPQPCAALPELADFRSCDDFEMHARGCLSQVTWDYLCGGEADTIARNRSDFGSYVFRPRVLRDVSAIDTKCNLFGMPCDTPLYLSSVAKGSLVAGPAGEAAFVRAAARIRTAYLAPAVSSLPLPNIWEAASAEQQLPFQFYLLGDEADSMQRLRQAVELGTTAVVVTVDANAPRAGAFHRSTATSAQGVFPSPRLTWERLAEVKDALPDNMPLYLKGVQTAEDALRAVRFGLHGIIVSNHGGRCCGDACGALTALEDIAAALRAENMFQSVELLYDSGVRSGRDALKALCLGATGVGIGRPYYWAAACYGEDGVVALFELLDMELRHAMAQVGAPTLAHLSSKLLYRASSGTAYVPLSARDRPGDSDCNDTKRDAVSAGDPPRARL